MANLFPKAYVGFYYQKKGQFYHCLILSEKAGEQWEYLANNGYEIIHMEDLEEDREIKSFLIRGAHYAEVWLKLAS